MSMSDSYKIYGAVLGTALCVFGLKELSAAIYHSETPEKQGFALEDTSGAEAEGGGEPEAEKVVLALADVVKLGDPAKGAAIAKTKCGTCHVFAKGGATKQGPTLWEVVERPIAAHEGFKYSAAMTAKAAEAKIWSYANLNQFLTKPAAYVPKSKMTFAGLKDADRGAVLLYLQSLSDAPKPLPAQ
jgi:cytochrome c